MSFRKPCVPHAIPQTHSIFYPRSPRFWRQSSSCLHFCGLDYEEKGILDQFSRSISVFCTDTKILLAFISRVAWQHRYYIKKVGHWRKDLLEGHDQFRFNFFSVKDNCTINFTLFFYLYLLLKPREKCFCFKRRVTWSWHNILYFVSLAAWWSFRHLKLTTGGEVRARILAIEFVCFLFFFFRSYF